ncbi:MAG: N-acetyltransferase [Actinomycetota bacterium]|nr:N-acetyltransferase [Actinomycetota bacterium]
MSQPDADVTVRDNPDKSRYEAIVDGATAGFATYERHDGLIAFLHTEVDDAYEGQGIGHVLVQQSLHDVRHKELTVRPVCPFYKKFFSEHPEYADLLGN